MIEKYKDTYRIPSARLKSWNYGQEGRYFITINTKGREHFFGSVKSHNNNNGSEAFMELSKTGVITKNEWIKTFTVSLDMNLTQGENVREKIFQQLLEDLKVVLLDRLK